MQSGDAVDTVAVDFDKFVFMTAGVFKIDDFFGGNFVVHAGAFEHESIAGSTVGRADELKLCEVPGGVVRIELARTRHESFGDFGGTAVVFFDVFKKIENGIAKLVSAHDTLGNKKAASRETAYRGLIKFECREEVNRGRWDVSA